MPCNQVVEKPHLFGSYSVLGAVHIVLHLMEPKSPDSHSGAFPNTSPRKDRRKGKNHFFFILMYQTG